MKRTKLDLAPEYMMSSRGLTVGWSIVLFAMVSALSFWVMTATAPTEDQYNKILSSEGFTEVQYNGYAFLGCGENDFYRESFTGIKNGVTVSGVLCSSSFKGTTIRYTP